MKTLIIVSLILSFFITSSYSQYDLNPGKREEIKKQELLFIAQELQLTEKEKIDFLPVYMEYDKKREDMHMQKRTMMHNFMLNNLNMSNEELTGIVDKLIDFDNKDAQLTKEYYEKFKKVLPPLKIILLYHAEMEFKKMVLKQAHGGNMHNP
jgi:hypothetical protein